ncbi:DUF4335 domain-containing protein [Nodosilinea sp. E11]|uniref:DUF4335 domain-containing protein n=1 Tax=Nodosilinea sp. E11 TaxID=3037479 RepID=UPI00293416E6|nr:DUF4335 domain-containing protein [Nodosilinea sp. E11]WOD38477.1 DUF4335 domain-containing protein [Nodosilinea sp. E11]
MAQIASVTSYEYTAGTCTLRLIGHLSPLSQVTGRPVLTRSRFSLQVHGLEDGADAEAARPAVLFEASGREPQFSTLTNLVQTYVQAHLSAQALSPGAALARGDSSLQPVGLMRHRLTLATPPAPPQVVELSTLQLSDLADTLEQADGTLQIIPDDALPKARPARPRLPLWLGSVAAVGIAAILGNQLLTTTPSPVVLNAPDSSDAIGGSTTQAPSPDRELPLDEATPFSEAVPEAALSSPSATGEALPTPTTTAPTTTSAPPGTSGQGSPKLSPQPATPTTPQPGTSPGVTPPPAASPQPEARVREPAASPDADFSAQQSTPASPETLRAAPDSPAAAITAAEPTATESSDLALALQRQWRPPANLAAPLRYTLTLAANGTVIDLVPLNEFSATYQNTPTLPQVNAVIPGITYGARIIVEVQFLPTGEVLVLPTEAPTP